MTARCRLSESISEGDGISVLVHTAAATDIAMAEQHEVEGVVAGQRALVALAATTLPVIARGLLPEEAGEAGADAWLLVAADHGDELEMRYSEAHALGLECVVEVRDEEELEVVLARIDPEIVLLSPRAAEHAEEAVDCVLELLPDVPAGKLVVAELRAPTVEDLEALERAGIDAVLVGLGGLAAS